VRWAEVRFYDLNVFGEYPQVEETPGNTVQLGKPATIEQVDNLWVVNFDETLPEEIWNAGSGELLFDDVSGTTLQVEFDNEMSAHVPNDVDPPTLVGEHVVVSVKVPPERSRNDTENKTPVTVHLKAPATLRRRNSQAGVRGIWTVLAGQALRSCPLRGWRFPECAGR
jgi:hypothetical protein